MTFWRTSTLSSTWKREDITRVVCLKEETSLRLLEREDITKTVCLKEKTLLTLFERELLSKEVLLIAFHSAFISP